MDILWTIQNEKELACARIYKEYILVCGPLNSVQQKVSMLGDATAEEILFAVDGRGRASGLQSYLYTLSELFLWQRV